MGKIMDRPHTPDAVATWLQNVKVVEDDDDLDPRDGGQQLDDSGHESSPGKKVTPCTPLQRPQLAQIYDEVSPTDTNFSNTTIFDTPTSPISPLARKAGYAETIASSVEDDDDIEDVDGVCRPQRSTAVNEAAVTISPPAFRLFLRRAEEQEPKEQEQAASRLNTLPPSPNPQHPEPKDDRDAELPWSSIDTSVSASILPNPPLPSPPPTPVLVFFQSCLQCTLADLPCSRTPPSCTRCVRNGCGSLCLLLRRRQSFDHVKGYTLLMPFPVLLKTVGTDEGVWRRKVELAEGLVRRWREGRERANWVLPSSVVCERGGWKGEGRVLEFHPGGGRGRVGWGWVCLEGL
ncbi:hypothetical protein CC80DRAFT_560942 [Byssothecium circinans]|uniref:Zn(2)-C6 fungal-type domain-containing protein n=1 Tax=Byssothecium circinans TaxID=147558 RepID=A0A6A5TY55_9PLEO|nr:hypothetical protein CC80DRAFT_560942 [Byssothecium circinans]